MKINLQQVVPMVMIDTVLVVLGAVIGIQPGLHHYSAIGVAQGVLRNTLIGLFLPALLISLFLALKKFRVRTQCVAAFAAGLLPALTLSSSIIWHVP